MGEKIRDIQPIKIGKSSLMIELNEGYTASEGRLIHIQNKKFRYLLKERDFYDLSAMVLRAWSEFDYIKTRKFQQRAEKEFPEREKTTEATVSMVRQIEGGLVSQEIDYRVLDIQNRMVTIIVREDNLSELMKYIKNKGGKTINHPYGTEYGYRFIYQMKPFRLFKVGNFLIEIYCQLPCASLTPKMWIPLDRKIQKEVWSVPLAEGIRMCDLKCQYIFHLCWAIFFNKGFSPYALSFLKNNKAVIRDNRTRDLLLVVFFNYTDQLIKQIESDSYETIITNYYSFMEY